MQGVGVLAMAIIGFAGLTKAIDVSEFRTALEGWSILSPIVRDVVAVVVPAVELGIVALWLASGRRRWCLWMAFVMVLVFAVAIVWEWRASSTVRCACFGALDRQWSFLASPSAILARDALLAAALFVGWLGGNPSLSRASVTRKPILTAARRAFTLIELLVVIAIIALLLGFTFAGLAKSRESGRATASLAALRGHAQIFSQYTGDERGAYPYFGIPETGRIGFPVGAERMDAEYFHAFSFWAFALAERYYGGDVWHPSFYSAEVPVDPRHERAIGVTSYHYPCAFVARPEYWRPDARIIGHLPQLAATRSAEVLFPDRKALLVNATRLARQFDHVARRGPHYFADVAMSDGSTRTVRTSDFTDGMAEGDGPGAPGAVHSAEGVAPFHTVDGVRGRDVGG